jgi:hypothetical protein
VKIEYNITSLLDCLILLTIIIPGKRVVHQIPLVISLCPSLSILPQLGIWGGIPSPKKNCVQNNRGEKAEPSPVLLAETDRWFAVV